jgi:hypothetical protein
MVLQWSIKHLDRDKYELENTQAKSFAGYDTRPEVGVSVISKWTKASVIWSIRPAQTVGAYT